MAFKLPEPMVAKGKESVEPCGKTWSECVHACVYVCVCVHACQALNNNNACLDQCACIPLPYETEA